MCCVWGIGYLALSWVAWVIVANRICFHVLSGSWHDAEPMFGQPWLSSLKKKKKKGCMNSVLYSSSSSFDLRLPPPLIPLYAVLDVTQLEPVPYLSRGCRIRFNVLPPFHIHTRFNSSVNSLLWLSQKYVIRTVYPSRTRFWHAGLN